MSSIVLSNLTKKIKFGHYFKDVTLSFPQYKIIGILGKNNSGKTSLCKMIIGDDLDYEGDITIFTNESNVNLEDDRSNKIEFISGKESMEHEVPLLDYFSDVIESSSLSITDDEFESVLSEVGLELYSQTNISEMSALKKQKIKLARVLLTNPDLIVLDEPFFGLGEFSKIELKSVLIMLMKQKRTIVVTSPHEKDLKEICDTIYLIGDEKLLPFN